tara:strand:+ start:282 stop:704 length:423 start_codon:yes stop_codon:yes gene_type:complete
MAKFIKFPCTNTAVVAPLSPINNILVNVEDITTVTATGATGGGVAKTVVIGLTGRAAQAAAAGGAGGTRLTLSVSTSTALPLVNPTLITGQQNPLVAAVRGAMTANPGGVVTTCSPGFDDIATVANPNGIRMYWATATYA